MHLKSSCKWHNVARIRLGYKAYYTLHIIVAGNSKQAFGTCSFDLASFPTPSIFCLPILQPLKAINFSTKFRRETSFTPLNSYLCPGYRGCSLRASYFTRNTRVFLRWLTFSLVAMTGSLHHLYLQRSSYHRLLCLGMPKRTSHKPKAKMRLQFVN
jgi:hypothetical protein